LGKPVAAEAAPAKGAPTKRLFFALWPDPVLKARIAFAARLTARTGSGKRVRDEHLHLTVLFLGAVDAKAEARLVQAAAALKAAAFELVLDRVGCFFRSRVVWVGPSHAPAPLADLRRQLEGVARQAGVAFDAKALVPHVTCYRDARQALEPAPIEPLHWPVRSFALVHSVGGQYHVVSQWPLQNASVTNVKTVQSTRRK
jgi:RNA 2',3'-cyclic 3'-phosphodiesterase